MSPVSFFSKNLAPSYNVSQNGRYKCVVRAENLVNRIVMRYFINISKRWETIIFLSSGPCVCNCICHSIGYLRWQWTLWYGMFNCNNNKNAPKCIFTLRRKIFSKFSWMKANEPYMHATLKCYAFWKYSSNLKSRLHLFITRHSDRLSNDMQPASEQANEWEKNEMSNTPQHVVWVIFLLLDISSFTLFWLIYLGIRHHSENIMPIRMNQIDNISE